MRIKNINILRSILEMSNLGMNDCVFDEVKQHVKLDYICGAYGELQMSRS